MFSWFLEVPSQRACGVKAGDIKCELRNSEIVNLQGLAHKRNDIHRT